MLWNLFLQIIAGILGLFLAQRYVTGVDFAGPLFLLPKDESSLNAFLGTLVFVGALLGFLNYFIKPLLKLITLPLRIITFNLFSIVIAMFLVWLVDILSPELTVQGLKALFFATLIVWGMGLVLLKLFPGKSRFETEK